MKVFTSNHCSPCVILERILKEKNIKYEEVNIETEEGLQEALKHGVKAVPAILKNGKLYVGLPLDPKKLEEMLDVR